MVTALVEEFQGLRLGDKRLDRRATKIISRISEKPRESFPNIFEDRSELEAFYRFVENPYVSNDVLLQPHIKATIGRIESQQTALAIHDTSEFVFSGKRRGLPTSSCKSGASFLGHCCLAASIDGQPLGILRINTWVRDKPTPTALRKAGVSQAKTRKLPSERDHWFEGVQQTTALTINRSKLIHVCDSEGDDYSLLSRMKNEHYRFVVRACYDRKVEPTPEKLRQVLAQYPIIAERSVTISAHKKVRDEKRTAERQERQTTLEISSGKIELKKPTIAPNDLPASLELNVVYVKEKNPPIGSEPIEWILYTTESISTEEEILRVVDIYRKRWLIEEFFKALKTGCAFEARQLESYDCLLTCLSLFVPISWLMMHMRTQSRQEPDIPAEEILPPLLLEVLRHYTGKPIETGQKALYAVAGLGGHIKNNGPPGWLVLWRGFRELATIVKGFVLAKKLFSEVNQKM